MARSSRGRVGSAQPDAVSASVDAFRQILRALRLAAQDTLASTGMSAAQLFVLRALADGAEASMTDLAARTITDRSSVKVVVDRLIDAGLVTKGTSANDRRRAAVQITASGRAMLRGAPRPPTALLVDALKQLRSAELEHLARGLGALTRSMGIADERTEMLFEEDTARSARGAPRRTPRD